MDDKKKTDKKQKPEKYPPIYWQNGTYWIRTNTGYFSVTSLGELNHRIIDGVMWIVDG